MKKIRELRDRQLKRSAVYFDISGEHPTDEELRDISEKDEFLLKQDDKGNNEQFERQMKRYI